MKNYASTPRIVLVEKLPSQIRKLVSTLSENDVRQVEPIFVNSKMMVFISQNVRIHGIIFIKEKTHEFVTDYVAIRTPKEFFSLDIEECGYAFSVVIHTLNPKTIEEQTVYSEENLKLIVDFLIKIHNSIKDLENYVGQE